MGEQGASKVFSVAQHTTDKWWQQLRPRLTFCYLAVATILLMLSIAGHMRLLSEVGKIFGGFTWTIDLDNDGEVVIVSTPPQLTSFVASADSLTNSTHIVAVNNIKGAQGLQQAYEHARVNDPITYTILQNRTTYTVTQPALNFTFDMWWQTFGLAALAGMTWLVLGFILLVTASEWTGAIEGITMLPPAILLLLYSHWGNIQQASPPDEVVQLLWTPAFALLGAAFINLSLTYMPETISSVRKLRMTVDVLPYLPLVALVTYEWTSLLLLKHVPTRINILLSLGYGVVGGTISFIIGLTSLLSIAGLQIFKRKGVVGRAIPSHLRRRLGDLLTLWLGGVGLGFCLGVLPILFTGHTLLPMPIFYTLATVFPFVLWYAIRSLRLMDRLQLSLEEREQALEALQSTASELQQSNSELQHATSLLLHADAHLRSLLSQRIHDQPKQQALRIRSLLGHWQHKLRLEAEHDPEGKVVAQPFSEALGKVRKISEELESDLRGLQMLVEDAYQRRSLGLKLHLDKLIREDLPMLHAESQLKVQADLWALDALSPDLEQTEQGEKIAEAISYTVTQALLNIYNHAGASYVVIRTKYTNNLLEMHMLDDGRGFDITTVSPEKTSLFKAHMKTREAGGTLTITSTPRPQPGHGTSVTLRIPLAQGEHQASIEPSGDAQKQANVPNYSSTTNW